MIFVACTAARVCLYRVEQALEGFAGAAPGAHGGEFHVADCRSGFAARARVADGEGGELRVVAQENRVAEFLAVHGADFALDVEAFEICVRHFARRRQEFDAESSILASDKRVIS